MGFSYNVNVLNQKGSPALYTDTFANRPNAGYAGRLFIANDTSAIYEDTGTAWTLIANVSSGAGTLQQVTTNGNTSNVGILISAGGLSTNSLTDTALTSGSVTFAGTGGLISQDNANLFWDDTNNRLGINTNTPGNSLDVHTSGTAPILALNNTAGSQSAISFLNTSVSKWRIGNTATNTFDIHNFANGLTAISISGTNNAAAFNANILIAQSSTINQLAGYNAISGDSAGIYFFLGTSANRAYFVLNSLTGPQNYTLPNATGTLALTSDLSGYLPLSGGTLTGALSGTTLTLNAAGNKLALNGATGAGGQNGLTWAAITGFTNSFYLYNGNSSGAYGLHCYDNTVAAVRFTVSNNGNFLIGSTTDNTVDKLQVTGSAKITNGIQFANGSALVNSVLNDYETGTFTPTITAITGSYTTVTNQRGSYTKVGRLVTIQLYFVVSNKGTGSAGAQVSNLPFLSKTGSAGDNYTGTGINTSTAILSTIILPQNSTTASIYNYLGLDGIVASQGNSFTLTYEASF